MLQSPGVKQPHDPGDWASYLLARRRCTSPAPPREPDRAGGTLRPPHIERRAASRALRPRRLALRTRGDRAREPGGGKISASRQWAAIERSRPRSIFFAPPNISSRRRPAHTHSVRPTQLCRPALRKLEWPTINPPASTTRKVSGSRSWSCIRITATRA